MTTQFLRKLTVQWTLVCLVFAWLFTWQVCLGQGAAERYQLGRRLERFERAWQEAPSELRAKSTASLEQAVQSFFSLALSRAGRMLDQAWLEVQGIEGAQQSEQLQSLRWKLEPQTTLLDFNEPLLRARVGSFYDAEGIEGRKIEGRNIEGKNIEGKNIEGKNIEGKNIEGKKIEDRNIEGRNIEGRNIEGKNIEGGNGQGQEANGGSEWPQELELELNVWPWDDSPAKVMMAQIGKEPLIRKTIQVRLGETFEVDFKGLSAGDYVLTGRCLSDEGGKHDWICPSFSLVDRLEDRMTRMNRWVEAHRKESKQPDSTVLSTARFLAREIVRGRKGTPFEIDLPWNKLLGEFEQIIESLERQEPNEESFAAWIKQPGWKWMQLSQGRSTQVVRIEVPLLDLKDTGSKLPVLIALHGAGGSENMFFQTYGAGRLVELGKARRWIVVSPRQTLTGLNLDVPEMVQALSEHLPVDSSRVMVVGHSMGAAQAMAQVSKHPESVTMLAALGGGGNVRDSEAIRKVPFYVAAGERDFGKPRAKSLRQQLERIGCPVEYREYPNVEHMVIVQAALDDVFAFFDKGLR
jgi:predicted esterase